MLRQISVSHVRVAAFIVTENNGSAPAIASCNRRSVSHGASRHAPHWLRFAKMHRASSPLMLRSVAARTSTPPPRHRCAAMRLEAWGRMHSLVLILRDARTRVRSLPNVFGMRAPQDEDEHRVVHSSRFQTAHLVLATRWRPRLATLLRSPRMRVGGAPIRHPRLLTSPQVAPGHFKVIILLPCVALTPPLASSGNIMSNRDRSRGSHARLEQAFGLLRTQRSS